MTRPATRPDRVEAACLQSGNKVLHGFFGRRGGVSSGIYSSLNCGPGSGDAPQNVYENRSRVMSALGLDPGALRTNHQVHGRIVTHVNSAAPWQERPKADALVTSVPGIALGILTADCVPVLFADADAGIVGAAHAGWRGALAGVAEATVRAMTRLGARPENIATALGPSISADSYEVGPEFPDPFLAKDPGCEVWFRPSDRNGHHLFDLAGYLEKKLEGLGMQAVERIPADTCAEQERFFSYRRATRSGEPDYGRELSVIALPG